MTRKTEGFTYIGLLILVAVIGIALAGTAEVISTEARRDREQELLFIGTQYAAAIASYRASSPGAEAYPTTLEALLEDKRNPAMVRHLRRLYRDPMTRSADWGLLRGPNNGIIGVYSLSPEAPLKAAGFPKRYEDFATAKTYQDWQFKGAPEGAATLVPGPQNEGYPPSAPNNPAPAKPPPSPAN
jgi:type II secretory pathway pseudopilin PulG